MGPDRAVAAEFGRATGAIRSVATARSLKALFTDVPVRDYLTGPSCGVRSLAGGAEAEPPFSVLLLSMQSTRVLYGVEDRHRRTAVIELFFRNGA